MKHLIWLGCVGALVVGLFLSIGVGVVTMFGGADGGESAGAAGTASAPGGAGVPPAMLGLYQEAAAGCPGLDWRVLAAIGTVESDNGLSNLPGVRSGQNAAGAEGPMQFEPGTFAAYADPAPRGGSDPPSPYDPTDAVYAAARMLCANGAGDPARLADAVYAYNHSDAYVREVLSLAMGLSANGEPSGELTGSARGLVAAGFALAQVGTPYRWGAEQSGVGFDCSGLAQAAWRAAGVAIPRVAQAQRDSGAQLDAGEMLQPGDLVFFGKGTDSVAHVGIVVAPGMMVDAPHSGAVVRIEPYPSTIGAGWGGEEFVGARRPGL